MVLLLSCFEATTLLPSQLALIYSFLLKKAKGGYRVINLLAGPYRLWVRARRVQARVWERQHFRRYMAFTAGGGAERTVFRQTLLAETHALQGINTVALLWDIASYYELIDRSLLQQRAEAQAFPRQILRCCLRVYQGLRVLGWQGLVQLVGFSRRGLPAGCGMVTYFIQAYIMQPVDWLLKQWEKTVFFFSLDVYIDDFALALADEKEGVL
eukprot:7332051-Lingulodinium_polyedra.AAC.1